MLIQHKIYYMVHILVADKIENLPRFTCDSSEIMIMDNSDNISEDEDDTQDTLMESIDDVKDVNKNEQKSTSNKKYCLLFKPSSSSISNRLRRKRKVFKK
jgi:hypothetical protein